MNDLWKKGHLNLCECNIRSCIMDHNSTRSTKTNRRSNPGQGGRMGLGGKTTFHNYCLQYTSIYHLAAFHIFLAEQSTRRWTEGWDWGFMWLAWRAEEVSVSRTSSDTLGMSQLGAPMVNSQLHFCTNLLQLSLQALSLGLQLSTNDIPWHHLRWSLVLFSLSCARLKKRGLSWEKFQQLARGKLPIVPQEIAW